MHNYLKLLWRRSRQVFGLRFLNKICGNVPFCVNTQCHNTVRETYMILERLFKEQWARIS